MNECWLLLLQMNPNSAFSLRARVVIQRVEKDYNYCVLKNKRNVREV
jgi:hypothetical protein